MGKQDLIKHCSTQGHQERAKALESQSKLNFLNPAASEEATKRTEAEVRMAVLTASCNIPLAFHDQLSPMFRSIFPDSKVATTQRQQKQHAYSIWQ